MSWMTLVLRTRTDPLGLSGAVREQVRTMDGDLPILRLRTLDEHVERSFADRHFSMLLLGLFSSSKHNRLMAESSRRVATFWVAATPR